MREAALEQACRKLAANSGCHLVKVSGVRGFPDRILIMPGGRTVYMEFKRPDGEGVVSAMQQVWAERLQLLGHEYYLIENKQQFLKVIYEES